MLKSTIIERVCLNYVIVCDENSENTTSKELFYEDDLNFFPLKNC